MPLEEPAFEWVETADAVIVRLPAPAPEPPPMRWTTAVLCAVALLPLPVTLVLLWQAITEAPRDKRFWQTAAGVVAVHGCLLLVAIARLRRDARAPGKPSEPSVLAIAGGVFKIERAGPERDVDYSWEIAEIADVRISAAAPDGVFLGLKSLLAHALVPDEVIRVSVERRSGEVDDVFVSAPGRHWPAALEQRLRASLGLASVGDMRTDGSQELRVPEN